MVSNSKDKRDNNLLNITLETRESKDSSAQASSLHRLRLLSENSRAASDDEGYKFTKDGDHSSTQGMHENTTQS